MTPKLPRLLLACLLASLGLAGCGTTPAPDHPATGAPDAPLAVLTAPPPDWRSLDGRRVRIDAPLTITGNHRLARHGEVVASFHGRLFAPTERALPGPPANAVATRNQARQLVLALERPTPGSNDTSGATWRSGTVLERVEGVVRADRGPPLLLVDGPAHVVHAPRPPVPRIGGDLRLASLNLQNLFNGDGRGGGFPAARGARTHAAYLQQRARLVATLRALDADIVALMELENDGEGADSSLAQLVDALNADGHGAAGDRWRYVRNCALPCTDPSAGFGDQPIRVGLVYRADRVSPVGAAATLSGGPFQDRSRIPLAQAFRAGNGPVFTVVAVHLKSKGCTEAGALDRDQQDGQACWNATRLDSARRLDAWLEADPTRSGSDLVAIVGDLNAYAMENPLQFLRDSGWHDALRRADGLYGYVYDGQAGRLDHVLLSPALDKRLVGAAVWHANADEPADPDDASAAGAAAPWRSSDHDPLLVGLRLRAP
ncbi:ExeM/NucH family extracellular endonuclease [Luteimonas vadosa]|uniref:ExeM/NucH family extracellular endonuclease n=1 Tax=Luteimonas vadosa TaxID=1165507 RepID=A0ABP9DQG6_9GAMM